MTLRRPKRGSSRGSTKQLRYQHQSGTTIAVRPVGSGSKKDGTYLIYGRSGTGKTTIGGSFPKPLLLIDIKDEGEDSIADVPGVFVVEPQSLAEVEAIFWALKHDKAWRKYKTVVIDTLTQLQALIVAEVAAQKSKAKYAGKKGAGAWGTMTKQQWGTAADIMKTQIINFRSLDRHKVFIAQEKMIDPDEGNEDGVEDVIAPEIGPAMMKSVAGMACASASFIGQTFIRTRVVKNKLRKRRIAEYCMRVGPNPVYMTKARKPQSITMPDFVVNPTFESIINLAKGK